MKEVDLLVIGGGPAGMAAAVEAHKNGVRDIVILEREDSLGGILNQCIHNGFGLHIFGEELTGPEYAWRFVEEVKQKDIEFKLDTMVIGMTPDKTITAVNGREGIVRYRAKAVVLSMGCRERTRGALNIPGARPAGIYTAGTAQKFVNIEGYLPGKNVVILGSGDIGMIMARRMSLEGARVKMVCELMPYSNGLARNIVQCLDDFGIPLKLSHTVVKIHGGERLEGVTVARVDDNLVPIEETAEYVPCDTLLLSVGLIPENELSSEAGIALDPVTRGPVVDESMETSTDGVFACGNVLHVHDLVDNVTNEAYHAGRSAARYIREFTSGREGIADSDISGEDAVFDRPNGTRLASGTDAAITVEAGKGVRYTMPQLINPACGQEAITLLFRVTNVYRNAKILIKSGTEILYMAKRAIMAPGEMERLEMKGALLERVKKCAEISVQVES